MKGSSVYQDRIKKDAMTSLFFLFCLKQRNKLKTSILSLF